MPTLDFAGLMAAYVVVAMLLLSINLYSRWSWWVKVLANGVVAVFFWVSYISFPHLLGWPTRQDLPRQFYLHAVNIDEPSRIFLWGTELDGGLGRTVPRAYELAYSTTLHERVDVAARKLRKGIPIIGEIHVESTNVNEEANEAVVQPKNQTTDVVFFDAPAALIPRKD